MTSDERYMNHALNLARQGLGRVGNYRPSVGCVIVKDGVVIAAARTGDGGAPHAETVALEQAGKNAKGATAYVTLEPCAHEGNTPSCAQSLVQARVKRVVAACSDPDERTNGQGIKTLQGAGIEVVTGVLEKEALVVNQGFFLCVNENRPLVTLKMAMSIDGKIALGNGQSKWITGDLARRYAHLERARHDAVLVGVGTIKADDPELTTRLPGIDHRGVRVVLDSDLSISPNANFFKSCPLHPVIILHNAKSRKEDIEDREVKDVGVGKIGGVQLIQLDTKNISEVLRTLKNQGITRLLVEGGAQVHASFLRSGYVDRLLVFRAPSIIGGDGLSGVAGLDIKDMAAISRLKLQKIRMLGEDLLEIYS